MEDFAVRVFKFKEHENVLFIQRWVGTNSKLIELSANLKNPFTGDSSHQVFRKCSTRGKRIYYYSEGTDAGSVLAG